jgi:hypothetical protein
MRRAAISDDKFADESLRNLSLVWAEMAAMASLFAGERLGGLADKLPMFMFPSWTHHSVRLRNGVGTDPNPQSTIHVISDAKGCFVLHLKSKREAIANRNPYLHLRCAWETARQCSVVTQSRSRGSEIHDGAAYPRNLLKPLLWRLANDPTLRPAPRVISMVQSSGLVRID